MGSPDPSAAGPARPKHRTRDYTPPPPPDIALNLSDDNIPIGGTKEIILKFTNEGEGTLRSPAYFWDSILIAANESDLEPGEVEEFSIKVSAQDSSIGETFTKIAKVTGMFGDNDNREIYDKQFTIFFNSRGVLGDANSDGMVNENDFDIIVDLKSFVA